jgi:hypothetical protein
MPSPLSARALRLIRAGKVRWGPRWQTAMAEAMHLSQTYMNLIASGDKHVTDEVEEKLLQALQQERKNLRGISAELQTIIDEIKKEKSDAV